MTFIPVRSTRLVRDGTPRVDLDLAFVTLRARFHDPHLNAEAPLPEHFWAIHRLQGWRSEPVARSSTSDGGEGGCSFTREQIEKLGPGEYAFVLYPAPKEAREEYLGSHEAWLDLTSREQATWVTSMFPRPGELDSRVLMRIPAWTTTGKVATGGFRDVPFFGQGAADMQRAGCVSWEDLRRGLTSSRWDVSIDHEWIRAQIGFQMTNWATHATASLPSGVLVELVDDEGKRVGAGCGFVQFGMNIVYVLAKAICSSWNRLHVTFRVPQQPWVDLTAQTIKVGPPPSQDRNLVYQLPTQWHSLGMEAIAMVAGGEVIRGSVYAPWLKQREALSKHQAAQHVAMSFHLDDACLFTSRYSGMTVAQVSKSNRIATFDHLLAVRSPDPGGPDRPARPYLSDVVIDGPYLPARESFDPKSRADSTRLLFVDGTFYDLHDERVEGTPGTDLCVGARAAIANDHPVADYSDGTPYTPPWNDEKFGRFELHFFDVPGIQDPKTGAALQHLVAYIGVKFVKQDDSVQASTMAILHKHIGGAADRWSQGHPGVLKNPTIHPTQSPSKDYAFIPNGEPQSPTTIIRFRCFFAEVLEGKSHLELNIGNDPAGKHLSSTGKGTMTHYEHQVNKDEYYAFVPQPQVSVPDEPGPLADSDRALGSDFVLAHEFGHALGLRDEYCKAFWPNEVIDPSIQASPPVLAQFEQSEISGTSARPFFSDGRGMMNFNHLPRLRYLAQFKSALDNHPAFATSVARPVSLVHRNLSGHLIKYQLEHAKGNPWEPIQEWRIEGGHATLTLYPVSDDEGTVEQMFGPHNAMAAPTPRPTPDRFDGVLVVRTLYRFRFEDIPPKRQWEVMFEFAAFFYDVNRRPSPAFRFLLQGSSTWRQIALIFHPHIAYEDRGAGVLGLFDTADIELCHHADYTRTTVCDGLLQDSPPSTLVLREDAPYPNAITRLSLGLQTWFPLSEDTRGINDLPLTVSDLEDLARSVSEVVGEPLVVKTYT